MSFEVRTEFGGLDPEAKRALVAMQHAIKGHLDEQQRRNSRPRRPVTELVEEGSVFAKPGQVVRVQPSDEDIEVVLPPSDPGNGGEDIIVSFEGDGTAAGKVVVTPMSGTCANPGTTTLNTPGSYRFTSTGAPSEGELAETSNWSGPAPVALEDLPEIAPQRLLGNNTGATASPTELTASQVLDWVDSTRGTVPYRGAAAWAGLDPGVIELPIVSKGAGADPVYQQLATAGIADDAVTNVKLANMAQSTVKLRAAGAGTGDPSDGTATQVLDMIGTTRGSLLERGASSWGAIVPGTTEFPLCSKGTGADPVYQQLATAGITNDAVTDAKLRNSGPMSVIGRSANSTGDPADISVVASDNVLRESGSVLGFGTVATGGIANDAVTNAKLANMATARIKGRTTASTGDPEDLTVADSTSVTWNTSTGGAIAVERAALTGEATASANSNAVTVTRSTNFSGSPWTGAHKFNSSATLNNQLLMTSIITSTISADQNDFSPTGWGTANVVRLITNNTTPRAITGALAGSAGEVKCLLNVGNDGFNAQFTLNLESASSSAANRFAGVPGTTLAVLQTGMIIWYDGASSRWRILSAF